MKNTLRIHWKQLAVLAVLPLVGIVMASFSSSEKSSQTTEMKKSPWVDLGTPNIKKSEAFYTEVFGWTFMNDSHNGITNHLIKNNNKVIGSIFELPKAQGSAWIPAASIDHADMKAKSQELVKDGCKIIIGAIEINGRGDQLVMEGPEGEEFSIIKNNPYHNNSSYMKSAGSIMGIELWSSDAQKSAAFYDEAFEVTSSKDAQHGHWLFKRNNETIAAMINNPITNQGTQWGPYFYHSDIQMVADRVATLGGRLIAGPSPQLLDGKLIVIQDPNGALLCVHSL